MAKNKPYDISPLYPADYCFDYKTFDKDPEGYKFSELDIAYLNARELEDYLAREPMTAYERKLLIQWVASGHSVSESPGSRYIWLPESYSYDFLFVHRMDCEIRKAIKGMSKKDREAYLLEYMGLTDDDLPETDHIS